MHKKRSKLRPVVKINFFSPQLPSLFTLPHLPSQLRTAVSRDVKDPDMESLPLASVINIQ